MDPIAGPLLCWLQALHCWSFMGLVCLSQREREKERQRKKEIGVFTSLILPFFQSTLFFFSIFHSLFFNINFIITYLLIQTKPTSVSSLILSWIHRSKCFQTTHFDILYNFRDPLHLVSLLQLLLIYGSFH